MYPRQPGRSGHATFVASLATCACSAQPGQQRLVVSGILFQSDCVVGIDVEHGVCKCRVDECVNCAHVKINGSTCWHMESKGVVEHSDVDDSAMEAGVLQSEQLQSRVVMPESELVTRVLSWISASMYVQRWKVRALG